MTCGAVLYFDHETDGAIRGLWQAIEDAGLPSTMLGLTYPPHLTFQVCDGMHLSAMRPVLLKFIAEHPPLPLSFSGFGVFPSEQGVVYLAPVPCKPLMDLHSAFWDMSRPFITPENAYYNPETWVPHITLGYNLPPDQCGAVIAALSKIEWPRQGLLRELAIADFMVGEDGVGATTFKELFKARLGSYL